MVLDCAVEVKGFHIYIKYRYRRKDLWGINASLNNGYHINVKPKKHRNTPALSKHSPRFFRILLQKDMDAEEKEKLAVVTAAAAAFAYRWMIRFWI